MNRYVILLLILAAFVSCGKPLTKQPRTHLTYDQLPDTIKHIIILSTESGFLQRLNADFTPETHVVINLDSDIKTAEYEVETTGPWINGYEFTIDGHLLTLDFNSSQKIKDPYILYNHELYFVETMNLYRKDLETSDYGKFDLNSILE